MIKNIFLTTLVLFSSMSFAENKENVIDAKEKLSYYLFCTDLSKTAMRAGSEFYELGTITNTVEWLKSSQIGQLSKSSANAALRAIIGATELPKTTIKDDQNFYILFYQHDTLAKCLISVEEQFSKK